MDKSYKTIIKSRYPFLDDPEGIQARNSDLMKTTRAIRGLTITEIEDRYKISSSRFYACSTLKSKEHNPILNALNCLSKFAKYNDMSLIRYIVTIAALWDDKDVKKSGKKHLSK